MDGNLRFIITYFFVIIGFTLSLKYVAWCREEIVLAERRKKVLLIIGLVFFVALDIFLLKEGIGAILGTISSSK